MDYDKLKKLYESTLKQLDRENLDRKKLQEQFTAICKVLADKEEFVDGFPIKFRVEMMQAFGDLKENPSALKVVEAMEKWFTMGGTEKLKKKVHVVIHNEGGLLAGQRVFLDDSMAEACYNEWCANLGLDPEDPHSEKQDVFWDTAELE